MMVWAFTCLQWNCMARCINIAPLGFHNMSCKDAADSVVFQYDYNKKDQVGDNTSPKNCYANPFDANCNLFLALGCYLAINDEGYSRDTDQIFRKKGRDRSAAVSYSAALKKLILSKPKYEKAVFDFVRVGHFLPHG